jgi:hypothetical protein
MQYGIIFIISTSIAIDPRRAAQPVIRGSDALHIKPAPINKFAISMKTKLEYANESITWVVGENCSFVPPQGPGRFEVQKITLDQIIAA